MEAIPFMLFPCSDSWKKYSNRAERKVFHVFDVKLSIPVDQTLLDLQRLVDCLIERKLFANCFDNWSYISLIFTPKMWNVQVGASYM